MSYDVTSMIAALQERDVASLNYKGIMRALNDEQQFRLSESIFEFLRQSPHEMINWSYASDVRDFINAYLKEAYGATILDVDAAHPLWVCSGYYFASYLTKSGLHTIGDVRKLSYDDLFNGWFCFADILEITLAFRLSRVNTSPRAMYVKKMGMSKKTTRELLSLGLNTLHDLLEYDTGRLSFEESVSRTTIAEVSQTLVSQAFAQWRDRIDVSPWALLLNTDIPNKLCERLMGHKDTLGQIEHMHPFEISKLDFVGKKGTMDIITGIRNAQKRRLFLASKESLREAE